jgi:hypothetical protein
MTVKKIKQIAIYGKGGIGKSTTTSNISAALADAGYRVMQFGCYPKADSTNTLRGGEYIPSVLDLLSEKRRVDAHEAIFLGFGGIYCVEAGGPAPGVGCAGRGIITAVELLKQQDSSRAPDYLNCAPRLGSRLWRCQGKRFDRSDLLTPICGWFTEGRETSDFNEAMALLKNGM